MKTAAILFTVLLSTLGLHGSDFDLGARGVLSVETPEGWKISGQAAQKSDGSPLGYALAIKPLGDANAKCLVTFAYVKKEAPDRERVRKEVLDACEQFVADSVEKRKDLKEFSLKQGYGAYCVFTDASLVGKKPQRDDYQIMGSGIVQLSNEIMGVVSIFTDDINSKEFKAMLQAINSLKVKGAK